MKYWGLDWLIFLFVVTHLLLLNGEHKRLSYICGAISALLGLCFAIWVDAIGGMVANLTFAVLHVRNLLLLK
jgi:hypothetical protein